MEGGIDLPFLEKKKGAVIFWGDFFQGHIKSFTEKKNNIYALVSEILCYTHTHTHTQRQINILLLLYKDVFFLIMISSLQVLFNFNVSGI